MLISLFTVPVFTAQNLRRNSSLLFSLSSYTERNIVDTNSRKNIKNEYGSKKEPKKIKALIAPNMIDVTPLLDLEADTCLIRSLRYAIPNINHTVTPSNPLFAKVVKSSLEPETKVVFPSAIVASVDGLNRLYAIPKESLPSPTKPLKKSETIEELATTQEMSEPNLMGVIAVKDSPNTDLIKDSYWNPTLKPTERRANIPTTIARLFKPFSSFTHRIIHNRSVTTKNSIGTRIP